MTPAISVTGISKRFYYPAIPKQATLKEMIVKGWFREARKTNVVDALRDVSFAVEHGQTLGVIGRNGSGKTTLLRVLAGVFQPDSGSVYIDGSLAPLLSLAAGFHPDLTGRENARTELLVLGFTPRQVERHIDDIIDFADIGDFFDAPMRTYSTGMVMRVAFAAATSVDPDVLFLDEVLFVGDESFSTKCLDRITAFKRRGKAIVMVSHSNAAIVEHCDVALWLDRGRVAGFGDPSDITSAYHNAAMEASAQLLA